MAIRIRRVNGKLIALCAARSIDVGGDIYLDDETHHALGNKFARDYNEMYGYDIPASEDLGLIREAEANNSNRDQWDKQFKGVVPYQDYATLNTLLEPSTRKPSAVLIDALDVLTKAHMFDELYEVRQLILKLHRKGH